VEYKTMQVEIADGVATIMFNRPEKRNAVSMQFVTDLEAACDELFWDDSVRVVVLAGQGPVFCAGADLKERVGWDDKMLRLRRAKGRDSFQKLNNFPRPVLAAVQGAAIGAGAELALIADFAYAAEGTVFQWPEVTWGSVGATQRLARRVGKPKAKELLFTGKLIDAVEACSMGIVNRVLPADQLLPSVMETAKLIASRFPVTVTETKRAIDVGVEVPLTVGLEVERAGFEIGIRENEWRAGLQDFARRREVK